MKKIIDRLIEYIDFKSISLNAFDKSIGASNGYIGKQIKNKASMGGDVIEKISCIYTDLNIEWLITGKGAMIVGCDHESLRENLVEDLQPGYKGPPICERCRMKDELIESLRQQVETQSKLIDYLEEGKSPGEVGQKRKVAS